MRTHRVVGALGVLAAIAAATALAATTTGPSSNLAGYLDDTHNLGVTGSNLDALQYGIATCRLIDRHAGTTLTADEMAEYLARRDNHTTSWHLALMYAAVDNLCPDLAGKLP